MIPATATASSLPLRRFEEPEISLWVCVHGRIHPLTRALVACLRAHGFRVDAHGLGDPHASLDGRRALVLGSSTRRSDVEAFSRFIHANRAKLERSLTALFLVRSTEDQGHDPIADIDSCVERWGWRPDLAAAFTAGEPGPRAPAYSRTTSTTDVGRFADAIAVGLARSKKLWPRDARAV